MDEIDFAILGILQRDGRTPYTDIAQKLNISEGTVRHRVNRLLKQGALEIVGVVDPQQAGFDTQAIVAVSVQPSELERAAKKITELAEVTYMVMVSGEFDLFVEVVCRNREHLMNFLSHALLQVPGVQRTQTFMVLKAYKNAHGAPLLSAKA